QNLPVTKGIPVSYFKDLFYYGIRNHVALEETGDPTREAAVYSYIAASLLGLFTKPASNLLEDICLILRPRKDLFETKAKGRSDRKAKEKILCSVIGGFGVDSATLSL
ncbi:hypothetical protein Tco_1441200, partial [Tanacetum coccineum]